MSRSAGIRQTVAALLFQVCIRRSDAAKARFDAWERRAAAVRAWGEDE